MGFSSGGVNTDHYANILNTCMNMAKNASNLSYAPTAATTYNLATLTIANQISMNSYTILQLPTTQTVCAIICNTLTFGGGTIQLANPGLGGASGGYGNGAGGNPANSLIIVAKNIVVSSTSPGTINGNGAAGGVGSSIKGTTAGNSGICSYQGDNYTYAAGGTGGSGYNGGAGGGKPTFAMQHLFAALVLFFKATYYKQIQIVNGGGGAGGAISGVGYATGGGGGGSSACASGGAGGNSVVANTAVGGAGGGGGGAAGNVAILTPNPIPAGLTVNLNGGAGGAGYDNGGGGGGGAGGFGVFICPSFGGTFNATGGAAGTGSGNGSAGNNGTYWLIPWSL